MDSNFTAGVVNGGRNPRDLHCFLETRTSRSSSSNSSSSSSSSIVVVVVVVVIVVVVVVVVAKKSLTQRLAVGSARTLGIGQ